MDILIDHGNACMYQIAVISEPASQLGDIALLEECPNELIPPPPTTL